MATAAARYHKLQVRVIFLSLILTQEKSLTLKCSGINSKHVLFLVPRSGKNENHFILKIDLSNYILIIFFITYLKQKSWEFSRFLIFSKNVSKFSKPPKSWFEFFFNKLFFGFFETKTQTLPHFVFFVAMLQFAAYLNWEQTFEVFDFFHRSRAKLCKKHHLDY